MFRTPGGIVNRLARWQLTAPRAFSRLVAATLFPPRCCLCGFEGATLDLDLCSFCFAELPWDTRVDAALTALRYEPPADDLIRKLKYQAVIPNARVLGVLLAEAVKNRQAKLPRLLLPVPLHAARFRERGFNQALTIGRYAGRMLEVPLMTSALRRVRDTPSQTTLDVVERRQNVSGAFALDPHARRRLIEAGHVAIVDDVITTGSTVGELRALLLAAGVGRVDVWAVARVA